MKISTISIKRGDYIEVDDIIYIVDAAQFANPGKLGWCVMALSIRLIYTAYIKQLRLSGSNLHIRSTEKLTDNMSLKQHCESYISNNKISLIR